MYIWNLPGSVVVSLMLSYDYPGKPGFFIEYKLKNIDCWVVIIIYERII